MSDDEGSRPEDGRRGGSDRLVYRHSGWTRMTHWLWAISVFCLLVSGLQIFNAHPALYIGEESGFAYDNAVLRIGAENAEGGPVGYAEVLGYRLPTTGVLGLSERGGRPEARGFPAWATLPSYHDLASGRVVHFFFAWILGATLLAWLLASLAGGHLWRDIVPRRRDLAALPADIGDHARFRFHRRREYGSLQKLAYAGVLLVIFPLVVATGLAMSPGMNAFAPWLPELFGGRQTARTLHFAAMVALVLFFVVHILMVLAAGPLNEMRSIVTGWYRTDPARKGDGL